MDKPREKIDWLARLSSVDAPTRARALWAMMGGARTQPAFVAQFEALLEDRTCVLLMIPYVFGEIRLNAAEMLVGVRARLGDMRVITLKDVPRTLSVDQAGALMAEYGIERPKGPFNDAVHAGGVLYETIREAGVIPTRDHVLDPAEYRLNENGRMEWNPVRPPR